MRRLVLVVTAGWANETVQETVGRWLLLAERGDYRRLMRDTAERSYSQRYLRRYRLLLPLLGTIGRPRSYQRFLIQASASGMTPAARWDGSAVLHWWWAAAGIKWWGQRRPGCWQST